ncbi:MAG: molybdenum cofactor biosynthesis protein MoaE [Thermodesulfobacteriota bacterium]
MDVDSKISKLKKHPDFTRRVGMILIHNGVVRQWSRTDEKEVLCLKVKVDHERIENIVHQAEARPGIFKVIVETREGRFKPGDDLMLIVVAGDIRENVLPVLEQTLNRVKKEALSKQETTV